MTAEERRKRNRERMRRMRQDPAYRERENERDRARNRLRMRRLRQDPAYRGRENERRRARNRVRFCNPPLREQRAWPYPHVSRSTLGPVFPPSVVYNDPFDLVSRWEWTGVDLTGAIDHLPFIPPHAHPDAVARFERATGHV